MHKLILIATAAAALALAATAGAASPQHFRFTGHDQFVDTETCSFPIVGDFTNTSDVTEFDSPNGTIERLQLHQSSVGTLVGNGVTLTLSEHTQTFVTFVDGAATQAIHVGVLFHIVTHHGTASQVAGQEVWEVENGFDHTLISFHGVDFSGDDTTFCAAFL
jgi:hypothetical protein